MKNTLRSLVLFAALGAGAAHAAETTVTVHAVGKDGVGKSLGTVTLSDTEYGLELAPDLSGIEPGLHGFHIHENGSCEPATTGGKMTPAGAAGGHFDPRGAGGHGLPWGEGHLGDLPPLYVQPDGTAKHPVLAPRLTVEDVRGRALMVHAGGDNFADQPAPLGGGGARVACGVIAQD